MARFLNKVFAGNSLNSGQFGSFSAGTKVLSTDPATLSALPAYEQGWSAATDSFLKIPRGEEMEGVQRVISAGLVQQWKDGITFWQANMPVTQYQTIVQYQTGTELPKLYVNITGTNGASAPDTDQTNWKQLSLGGSSHVVGEIVSVFGTASYAPFGCVLADGTEYTKALFPSIWSDYLTGAETDTFYQLSSSLAPGFVGLIKSANPVVGDPIYMLSGGVAFSWGYVKSVSGASCTGEKFSSGGVDLFTITGTTISAKLPLLTVTDYGSYVEYINKFGECPCFALDTSNEKFKVPTIKDGGYLTQALSVGEIGKSYNESLPNHSHTITFDTADSETGNGYIGWEGAGTVRSYSVTSSSANQSTYQDGAPVQGDNVRVRFFVCLAGGAINDSMIDWQNYMTALSGKANTDLSNVTAAGKSAAVGWGMPDYTVGIDLSGYNSASNKFTAPCDGLIIMCGGGTANNAFNLVIDDEVYLFNNASTTHWVGQQFFIRKGSNFYYFGTLPEYGSRNFYPMEGAQ